ncbi:MAG: hypothetical protein ABFR53_11790 [Actinomycetota bacterium]
MNELDTAGRHHAQVLTSSIADIAPPPVDSLVSIAPRPSRSGFLIAFVGVAVAVGLVAVFAVRNDSAPSVPISESPSTSPSTTTSVPPPTTLGPGSLPAFDVSLFINSKLGDAFNERAADKVGVVALVPIESEQAFEDRLNSGTLSELQSYTYVPSVEVMAAAERFAAAQRTAPIEGDWIAYGLVPRYFDSPTGDWIGELSGVDGVRIAQVDFEPLAKLFPDGWQVITDLPFGVSTGAIVQAIDAGVVVIDGTSTRLVLADGSWVDGAPSPLEVQSRCCGDVRGLTAKDSVVLMNAGNSETWILDVETLAWRQAETPPATGFPVGWARYPLGSALIDGDLVVVTAAGRYINAISTVATLDLDTGTWHELDPVPSPIAVGGVTSDGNRLIVAGTAQDANNGVIGDRSPVAYQHTPDNGWEELPSIPVDGQASTVTWVDDAGLVAWNYDQQSAILDSSGQWQVIEDVSMPAMECYPRSVSADAGAVGLCGGLAWFDAATLSWQPIRTPIDARFASTRTDIIGFLGVGRDSTTLIRYDLPPSAPGS